ncbi:hypothetical protein [Chitinophaga sp. Cy-1792]|uniref:hypothetical protein n=1 Tax=Chitinophaga sp. Cy-1792 TaxID=2608339 RepID=UPI00141FF2A6|nr:hypothetical protein [Chitinophaga sp. Cy-1792]NIG54045.1 hypothetical protein [Chitinophaga sp. Cy-1792]
MKKLLIAATAALLVSASVYAYTNYSSKTAAATCTGSKNCNACKNCKYCKHCAKEGGSCGVCK